MPGGTVAEEQPRQAHEIEEAIVDEDGGEGDSETPSTEADDIDPSEFDLMLSRSVQSGGMALEAESVEHSMLRGPRRYSISSHARSRSRSRASTVMSRGGRGLSAVAHERTPLLAGFSGTGSGNAGAGPSNGKAVPPELAEGPEADGGAGVGKKSPFLGGVSTGRFWVIFGTTLVTQFIANFDGTIMASSHPAITSYFNSSNSASWLSTAFLLTSSAFQPLVGRLSDTVGRKPPYVITITIFMLATVWCALADSMTSLILARALCGLGAGGMMTMGSIIVSDLVPIEIRGTYQSYINITYGVGAMLGAATGGAMVDTLGWRWEFGIQVPALVLGIFVAMVALPDDIGLYGKKKEGFWEAMRAFDFKGSILLSSSITFLILGLSLGGNVFPWSHPLVIASLVAFATCFPVFLYLETTAVRPVMPLRFVRQSPHMNIIFSNFISCIILNAIFFNIPLYFQAVLLTSATTSGLRLMVPTLVASLCGTATGFLITWTRRLKWPVLGGTIGYVLGTICLAVMQRGWPSFAYLLCLVPSAVSQGFMFPGSFMAILAATAQADMAVVTSTLILWRSMGMVLGVASSSLVVQNALFYYLEVFVTGPEKERVIETVRESVESIQKLPHAYQEQVVMSYEAALRLTFICCVLLAVLNLLLVVPMRLPRLGDRK
ncbi:major facilitator superfamily transporter [Thozetella sp. PMI_491]|nr:major facilitator superfamily transporter [Thozetella sp. PMI_491]